MSYVRYQLYAHVDKVMQYNTKHRTRMLNYCSDLISINSLESSKVVLDISQFLENFLFTLFVESLLYITLYRGLIYMGGWVGACVCACVQPSYSKQRPLYLG